MPADPRPADLHTRVAAANQAPPRLWFARPPPESRREAAAAAGLPAARAREAVTARALGAAGATLLIAPCETMRDLRLKLAVVIPAGEAGPDDATTFPWWCLRVLVVEISPSPSWLGPRA